MTEIERTVSLATTVDDLPGAWAFIMGHLDAVGDDPRVTISPFWVYLEGDVSTRRFEVSVSGMTKETEA